MQNYRNLPALQTLPNTTTGHGIQPHVQRPVDMEGIMTYMTLAQREAYLGYRRTQMELPDLTKPPPIIPNPSSVGRDLSFSEMYSKTGYTYGCNSKTSYKLPPAYGYCNHPTNADGYCCKESGLLCTYPESHHRDERQSTDLVSRLQRIACAYERVETAVQPIALQRYSLPRAPNVMLPYAQQPVSTNLVVFRRY